MKKIKVSDEEIIFKLNNANRLMWNFRKEIKAISTGKYDQCSWIGKDNFEDKISVKCNVTFPNLPTSCDFKLTNPFASILLFLQ